ncbi:unnamed protein product [Pleuronectes platessa]|uniref:Uncharacterized protein n=1 Tax=Pleuronectes platessa TaxID=8262 RepID=A0A9N7VRL7_PLEPL|nr:unnamed protein product [Pleuronectes platessa]
MPLQIYSPGTSRRLSSIMTGSSCSGWHGGRGVVELEEEEAEEGVWSVGAWPQQQPADSVRFLHIHNTASCALLSGRSWSRSSGLIFPGDGVFYARRRKVPFTRASCCVPRGRSGFDRSCCCGVELVLFGVFSGRDPGLETEVAPGLCLHSRCLFL